MYLMREYSAHLPDQERERFENLRFTVPGLLDGEALTALSRFGLGQVASGDFPVDEVTRITSKLDRILEDLNDKLDTLVDLDRDIRSGVWEGK